MVVRASLSQLPNHGVGNYIFDVSKSPGKKRGRRFSKADRDMFLALWMHGLSIPEIADIMERDEGTIKQWRRTLDLPLRKPGYHKRDQRVAQMAAQITRRVDEGKVEPLRDIFRRWGVLDSAGRHVNGTDKETNHHYGDAYDDLFRAYDLNLHGWYSTRDKVKLMMEVGVADGSSLLAWKEAFPNAHCVGMDIHQADKLWRHDLSTPVPVQVDRIEFRIGDQRSREDCERIAAGRQFDLIVEDAVHSTENTLLTLFWLWPHVKPDGLYVVEEWANILSDWPRVKALLPLAERKDTFGPSGGTEPLVILRKPL